MELTNVYNYENPHQFLLDYFSRRQEEAPEFSVRKWAKEMDLKGHSLLVMLLQGKRRLRLQHCDFLRKGIQFDNNQQAYFQTLVQYQNAKSMEEKKLISGFLSDLNPGHDFKVKEVSEFMVISNWVHMAILAMTDLKNFRGTEEEIFKLLGGKVSMSEVRSCMVRLLDLNLLKWTEDGKLTPTYNRTTTSNDVSSAGAREYHKQVLDLAKKAVDKQDVLDREFQSFTMAVAEDKIPIAKDMIRKFRSKLSKAVSGDGDYVYQTSIQFFRLTENPELDSEESGVARDALRKSKEN